MKVSDQQALTRLGINVDLRSFNRNVEELHLQALAKLDEAVVHLESNANHYKELNEETLSSIVAGIISAGDIFTAKTEVNSRGHSDLFIFAPSLISDSIFQLIGEAKIWKGDVYQLGGYDQLLTYTSGRHSKSFFITYFRITDCDSKMSSFVTYLIQNRGGQDLSVTGSRKKHTTHTHPSGSSMAITHHVANLYVSKT